MKDVGSAVERAHQGLQDEVGRRSVSDRLGEVSQLDQTIRLPGATQCLCLWNRIN